MKEDEFLERNQPGQSKACLIFRWVGVIIPTPPTNCNPYGAPGNTFLIFCCEMRPLGRAHSTAYHIQNLDVKT